MNLIRRSMVLFGALGILLLHTNCASTTVTELPKTTSVAESAPVPEPDVIWTSRSVIKPYDYLGTIKVRSWTYDGAIERLLEGAKELKADAITDIHREDVGFLTEMQAFAIKYK